MNDIAITTSEFIAGLLGGIGAIFLLILFCFGATIFSIVCLWKCFKKMGEEGWKSIIPFYNTWTLCELTWGTGAMMFTWLIPFVGSIFAIATYWKMYSGFGKGFLFNIFGIFFQPITTAICAFDKSVYTKK